jgi:hypothetical protein
LSVNLSAVKALPVLAADAPTLGWRASLDASWEKKSSCLGMI